MRLILVSLLFILTGCSVSRYYKAPEVSRELEKNSQQLAMISSSVQLDYSDKKSFFKFYSEQVIDHKNYIHQDLYWRLQDLKIKKELVLKQVSYIKNINDVLVDKLNYHEFINEDDSLFNEIESFVKIKNEDAKNLFWDYNHYKKSSDDFAKFSVLTRNIIIKSTSNRDL